MCSGQSGLFQGNKIRATKIFQGFFWWSRGGLGISLGRPMVAKQNGVRQSRVDYIARVAMANFNDLRFLVISSTVYRIATAIGPRAN
jgi:hypothetical protein